MFLHSYSQKEIILQLRILKCLFSVALLFFDGILILPMHKLNDSVFLLKTRKTTKWLRLFLNIHEHIHNRWWSTLFLVFRPSSFFCEPLPHCLWTPPTSASFRPSLRTWILKPSFLVFSLTQFVLSVLHLEIFRYALLIMKKHLRAKNSSSCEPTHRSTREKEKSYELRNVFVIISLSILPYLSCLNGDFVFDDAESIVNNPIVNGEESRSQVIINTSLLSIKTIDSDIHSWFLGTSNCFSS